MIKLSFIKNSLLYTIGNALPMAASIILLPFYANYLDASNYVSLSFYIGISLLFQIFFSFSFEQYYGVMYADIKHDGALLKRTNGSMFIYLLLQGVGIILLMLLFGNFIFNIIFDKKINVTFFPYGLLSIITGFLNALYRVSLSTMIYYERAKLFFTANIVNFLTTIIFSVGGILLFFNSLNGPIYGRLLSGFMIVAFNYLVVKNDINWKFTLIHGKEFVKKSWPLFTYAVLIWITGNADRYFLKNFINIDDLAGYDLLMKCFIGIEFLQNGLSMAIISKIFNYWNKEKSIKADVIANRYFNTFITGNIIVAVLFCLVIPPFIKLIIKDSIYHSSFQFIELIAAGYVLRAISYPYYFAILFSKQTKKLLYIYSITTIVQIIASYFFIKYFHLIGAIYVGIFIKILIVLLSHLFSKDIFHLNNVNKWKWYGIPIFYLLITSISFFVFPANLILILVHSVLIILLILFVYKNELASLPKLTQKEE